jgi:hypothetical protein
MAQSDRPRVRDALAATDAAAPDRLDAVAHDLTRLQHQAGRTPAPVPPAAPGDPLEQARGHLDAVRSALAVRDRLGADLPRLAALADQERRQGRGPLVLVSLLVIVVLAVVIGQLL